MGLNKPVPSRTTAKVNRQGCETNTAPTPAQTRLVKCLYETYPIRDPGHFLSWDAPVIMAYHKLVLSLDHVHWCVSGANRYAFLAGNRTTLNFPKPPKTFMTSSTWAAAWFTTSNTRRRKSRICQPNELAPSGASDQA